MRERTELERNVEAAAVCFLCIVWLGASGSLVRERHREESPRIFRGNGVAWTDSALGGSDVRHAAQTVNASGDWLTWPAVPKQTAFSCAKPDSARAQDAKGTRARRASVELTPHHGRARWVEPSGTEPNAPLAASDIAATSLVLSSRRAPVRIEDEKTLLDTTGKLEALRCTSGRAGWCRPTADGPDRDQGAAGRVIPATSPIAGTAPRPTAVQP